METIVLQVKEGKLEAEFAKYQEQANKDIQTQLLAMQREIMTKERKIGDLEKKLRGRDEDIERLKAERDRLIAISNDLRAQLNQAHKRITEQAEDAIGLEEANFGSQDLQRKVEE